MTKGNHDRPPWTWSPTLDDEITAVSTTLDRSAESPLRQTDSWPMAPSVLWSGDLEDVPSADAIDPDPTPEALILPDSSTTMTATLTLLRGQEAGQTFRLSEASTVIGRDRRLADLVVKDTAVSRQHARIVRRDDGQFFLEDLGSTNGSFVRGQPVERTFLIAGDRIQIGPLALFRFSLAPEDEEALQRELFVSSTRDRLTGLVNRATLLQRMEAALERARRSALSVSVLMIDLDHFKRINDTQGHSTGDRVLQAIAKRISCVVRSGDVVGRYGGEEFAVLASPASLEQAHALAERIRSAIAEVAVRCDTGLVSTTASVGVAECGGTPDYSAASLLALADKRLYRAKRAGRNRVWSS